jgi:hypothetical protein
MEAFFIKINIYNTSFSYSLECSHNQIPVYSLFQKIGISFIMMVVFVKQFMKKLKQFFEYQNIPLQVFHNLENYVLYRYCKS